MTGFKPGDRVQPAAHCRDTWPSSAGTVVAPVTSPVRVVWDNAAMITVHPPTNLEPLGEPMTPEAPNLADFIGRTLRDRGGPAATAEVYSLEANPKGTLIVEGVIDLSALANLILTHLAGAPEGAASRALAILEAAGVEPTPFDEGPESTPGHAAWVLRHHVQETEAAAKEDADREALERRRDALAIEFGTSPLGYKDTFESTQRAIDRVIELEDRELREVTA